MTSESAAAVQQEQVNVSEFLAPFESSKLLRTFCATCGADLSGVAESTPAQQACGAGGGACGWRVCGAACRAKFIALHLREHMAVCGVVRTTLRTMRDKPHHSLEHKLVPPVRLALNDEMDKQRMRNIAQLSLCLMDASGGWKAQSVQQHRTLIDCLGMCGVGGSVIGVLWRRLTSCAAFNAADADERCDWLEKRAKAALARRDAADAQLVNLAIHAVHGTKKKPLSAPGLALQAAVSLACGDSAAAVVDLGRAFAALAAEPADEKLAGEPLRARFRALVSLCDVLSEAVSQHLAVPAGADWSLEAEYVRLAKRAVAVGASLHGADSPSVGRSQLHVAFALTKLQRIDEAIERAKAAYAMLAPGRKGADDTDLTRRASAATILCHILTVFQHRHAEALTYGSESLKMRSELAASRGPVAARQLLLSETKVHCALAALPLEPPRALALLEEASRDFEARGDTTSLNTTLLPVAEALARLGKFDDAVAKFRQATENVDAAAAAATPAAAAPTPLPGIEYWHSYAALAHLLLEQRELAEPLLERYRDATPSSVAVAQDTPRSLLAATLAELQSLRALWLVKRKRLDDAAAQLDHLKAWLDIAPPTPTPASKKEAAAAAAAAAARDPLDSIDGAHYLRARGALARARGNEAEATTLFRDAQRRANARGLKLSLRHQQLLAELAKELGEEPKKEEEKKKDETKEEKKTAAAE